MDSSPLFTYNAHHKNFEARMKINRVKLLSIHSIPFTKEVQAHIRKNYHKKSVRKMLKNANKITNYSNYHYQKIVFKTIPNIKQVALNIMQLSRLFLLRRFSTTFELVDAPIWKTIPKHISRIYISYQVETLYISSVIDDTLIIKFFRALREYDVRFFVNNAPAKIQANVYHYLEKQLKCYENKITNIHIDTTTISNTDLVRYWSQQATQYKSLTTLTIFYLLDTTKECETRLVSLTKNLSNIQNLEYLLVKVKQQEKGKNPSLLLKSIIGLIKSNPGLTTLKIWLECMFNQEFMVELAKVLKVFKYLTTLELKVNIKPDSFEQGLNILAGQISKFPIEDIHIDLSNSVFTDFDSSEFFGFFQNMTLMKYLQKLRVTFPAKKYFPFIRPKELASIKTNPNSAIEEITLHVRFPCDITALSRYIESFPYVKQLEFAVIEQQNNAKISQKDAKNLFQTLKKLEYLSSLKLVATGLEPQAHIEILKYIKNSEGLCELYLDVFPGPPLEYLDKYREIMRKVNLKWLYLNIHPKVQNSDTVTAMMASIKGNKSLERFKYVMTFYNIEKREIIEEEFNAPEVANRTSLKLFPFESGSNWF